MVDSISKKQVFVILGIAFLCCIGTVFLGSYLAGILAYKWLGVNADSTLTAIFDLTPYLEMANVPAFSKVKIFGACIAGVLIAIFPLLFAGLLLLGLKPKEEIHGSARFATDQEVAKSGLLSTAKKRAKNKYPSVLIGKYKGKFMHYSGQRFVYLAAPTRSGKGVGIVIPNLLTYEDSVVVVDIKFENFEYSAGFREQQGQEVFLFSPDGYEKDGKLFTHRYNPLHYVRRDPRYRDGDIRRIFASIFPSKQGDPWNDLAANFACGMTAYLMDIEAHHQKQGKPVETPTFSKLVELGGLKGGYLGVMNRAIQDHDENRLKLSEASLAEFNKFIKLHDKGQQSVLMSFYAEMNLYNNPTCRAAMSGNDFDFEDLRKKRISIYFGLTPNGLITYSKLINLFFSQLIMANTQVLPSANPDVLKYQTLLVLDEFPALQEVKILADAIGFTAGYGVRYLLIVQDHSQIEAIYGKERANNIRKNCAVQLIYPPKEVDEQTNRISETLGYKTVRRKENSYTYSGGKRSRNVSFREDRRALMLPQEIVELGTINYKETDVALKEIVLMEKVRPFIADKIIYFDEPALNARKEFSLKNIPAIPEMKFDLPLNLNHTTATIEENENEKDA
ncbi:type IV secretory system conjugative DNA transfer family protein [Bisgaard Taxon 10/6]|uniref:type IV secretory system conjugative DNA transfer family protein n=1 Tax=Exercitatus varius TaxID=67857 RepID=UPI00294AC865|nr:type IV secretory system conjugative DNA transfer family protein [Exercitatus varius]MDG2957053.1 type IV secretory system conjugative DNA transfer family protein [Exercitatus varius]MDG2965259.1 type IV secretory system conjugative DNA transfer family protein [Exercitatus varius]